MHDQLCLLPRLLLERDRRLLGRHERRPQQRLELAVPDEILLELLELVGKVRAFAPDVFEAQHDLVEQLVDGGSLVAPEETARRLDVSDLDRRQ